MRRNRKNNNYPKAPQSKVFFIIFFIISSIRIVIKLEIGRIVPLILRTIQVREEDMKENSMCKEAMMKHQG